MNKNTERLNVIREMSLLVTSGCLSSIIEIINPMPHVAKDELERRKNRKARTEAISKVNEIKTPFNVAPRIESSIILIQKGSCLSRFILGCLDLSFTLFYYVDFLGYLDFCTHTAI